MIKSNILPLVLILLGCCASCSDPSVVYSEKVKFDDYIWSIEQPAAFKVSITDTSLWYEVIMDLRHARIYPYKNLWVEITTTFPDGKAESSKVNAELADARGQWSGDCLGDICDLELVIQPKARFQQLGNHSIDISHVMREDKIPGVMALGLKIKKTSPPEGLLP